MRRAQLSDDFARSYDGQWRELSDWVSLSWGSAVILASWRFDNVYAGMASAICLGSKRSATQNEGRFEAKPHHGQYCRVPPNLLYGDCAQIAGLEHCRLWQCYSWGGYAGIKGPQSNACEGWPQRKLLWGITKKHSSSAVWNVNKCLPFPVTVHSLAIATLLYGHAFLLLDNCSESSFGTHDGEYNMLLLSILCRNSKHLLRLPDLCRLAVAE